MVKGLVKKKLKPKEEKNFFAGREVCIATKHKKERVISPILGSRLGMLPFTPFAIDTDLLGTFSGEIERTGSPIEVLRAKCAMAMELTRHDIAVASEGSFGPHPYLPFLYVNEEMILLSDVRNNIEIFAKTISTTTNFACAEVRTLNELINFAKKAMFPMHGLILKSSKIDTNDMKKGILDWGVLNESYHQLVKQNGSVFVETDMRADMNPLRMNVIRQVTKELVKKVQSKCPECSYPDFSVTSVRQGLPCIQCATPTKSILAKVSKCTSCGYQTELMYPRGEFFENPMYCDICNP